MHYTFENSLSQITYSVSSQAKIALKGKSEEQLLELEAIAKSLNLCARAVHDPCVPFLHSRWKPLLIHIFLSELTKGSEGTRTVLAIGPGTQLNDCQPNTNTDHNYSTCKSSERSDRQSKTFITPYNLIFTRIHIL